MGTLKDHLIVAIDTANPSQAERWVAQLSPHCAQFKLGLELLSAHGMTAPVILRRYTDLPFFFDLKLHDIPETVAKAVRALCAHKPSMLTVHASGGLEMMLAARTAAHEAGEGTKIAAVTMLTSLNDTDLKPLGMKENVAWNALQLTDAAIKGGARAIVCSPWEARQVAERCPRGIDIITPGIRSKGAGKGDQKRVMTAYEAVSRGATWVVVGRPITDAPDPVEAVIALAAEFEAERQAA